MSTENEGLLEVRDLKVHFPLPKKSLFGERSYVKAVDGVSFRVRKGTTFGIVGESGSGKTTIAKAVMGLVGVSGGSIRLEGNELVGIPEDRLKALRPKYQIVFQDPYSSLNPRMRVGKIVQDPLNLMDLGSHEEREEREKEVFEQIGLHQAQRALFPHQFSGGQRQRISIGRAQDGRVVLAVAVAVGQYWPGAGELSRTDHLRRARQRARRGHPGADTQPVHGPPGKEQPHVFVHFA